jgi:hypothetical protein
MTALADFLLYLAAHLPLQLETDKSNFEAGKCETVFQRNGKIGKFLVWAA